MRNGDGINSIINGGLVLRLVSGFSVRMGRN